MSLLELSNLLCSFFHGPQDDHKLSNKELETKYGTNIITVSHHRPGVGREPVTPQRGSLAHVCAKERGAFRMGDL